MTLHETLHEKYYTQMKKLVERELLDNWGHEEVHINADKLLCDLLYDLGYGAIVKQYEKLGRLYN